MALIPHFRQPLSFIEEWKTASVSEHEETFERFMTWIQKKEEVR